MKGFAVHRRELPVAIVRGLASYKERWRFVHTHDRDEGVKGDCAAAGVAWFAGLASDLHELDEATPGEVQLEVDLSSRKNRTRRNFVELIPAQYPMRYSRLSIGAVAWSEVGGGVQPFTRRSAGPRCYL